MINRLFAIIMSLLLTALASAYGTDPTDAAFTQDNSSVYEETEQVETGTEASEDLSAQSGIDAEYEENNDTVEQ